MDSVHLFVTLLIMRSTEEVNPALAKRRKYAAMVEQSTMLVIKDYIEGKRGLQTYLLRLLESGELEQVYIRSLDDDDAASLSMFPPNTLYMKQVTYIT